MIKQQLQEQTTKTKLQNIQNSQNTKQIKFIDNIQTSQIKIQKNQIISQNNSDLQEMIITQLKKQIIKNNNMNKYEQNKFIQIYNTKKYGLNQFQHNLSLQRIAQLAKKYDFISKDQWYPITDSTQIPSQIIKTGIPTIKIKSRYVTKKIQKLLPIQFSKLQRLYLDEIWIDTLQCIAFINCPLLKQICIFYCNFINIKSLQKSVFKHLKGLDINRTQIRQIKGIERFNIVNNNEFKLDFLKMYREDIHDIRFMYRMQLGNVRKLCEQLIRFVRTFKIIQIFTDKQYIDTVQGLIRLSIIINSKIMEEAYKVVIDKGQF